MLHKIKNTNAKGTWVQGMRRKVVPALKATDMGPNLYFDINEVKLKLLQNTESQSGHHVICACELYSPLRLKMCNSLEKFILNLTKMCDTDFFLNNGR